MKKLLKFIALLLAIVLGSFLIAEAAISIVPNGGTGIGASGCSYGLLAGGTTTTSPFQTVCGVGTSGQLLVSHGAGMLPSWQNASSTGAVTGTGTSGENTYWTGTSTISGDTNNLWDFTNQRLGINIAPTFAGAEIDSNPAKLSASGGQSFSGPGLNNGTYTGTYNGSFLTAIYEVTIDSTGTPDTFSWTYGYGTEWITEQNHIPITGGAQTLQAGLSITFGTTTGHTVGGTWTYIVNTSGDNTINLWSPLQTGDPTSFLDVGGNLTLLNDEAGNVTQLNMNNGNPPLYINVNSDGYQYAQIGDGFAGENTAAGFQASADSGGVILDVSSNENTTTPGIARLNTGATNGLYIGSAVAPINFGVGAGNTPQVTLDTSTGFLGVGKTAPSVRLDVNDATKGSGSLPDSSIKGIQSAYSSNSTSTGFVNNYYYTEQSADLSSSSFSGFENQVVTSHNSGDVNQVFGLINEYLMNGTGNVDSIKLNASGGNTTAAGTIGNLYDYYAQPIANAGGATIGSIYAFYADTFPVGVTNKWGFFSSDPTANNYFAGFTGIGTGGGTPGNVLEVGNNVGLGTGYTGIRVGVNSSTTALGSTTKALSVDSNGDVGLYTVSSGGGGTVTSVGLADGSTSPIYTISGSPVTSSGTLTFTLGTQSANTIFAGPSSGGVAQPTFRSLVTADYPTNSVTYPKIQQVGSYSLLGNPTGSTANVSEITLGSGLTFSGTTLTATGSGGTVTGAANGLTDSSNTVILGGTLNQNTNIAPAGFNFSVNLAELANNGVLILEPALSLVGMEDGSNHFNGLDTTATNNTLITGGSNTAVISGSGIQFPALANSSATKFLQADSSGNITSVSVPSGTVTGTCTATQVAFWSTTTAISCDSNLFWDSTNKFLGVGNGAPSTRLDIGGNITAASWGTSGILMRTDAVTVTDSSTASLGTVSVGAITSFGTPTIAASNSSVTYTNAATVYINAQPTAGTNVTIGNPFALYISSGNVFASNSVVNTQRLVTGSSSFNTGAFNTGGSNLRSIANTITDSATAGSGILALGAVNALAVSTIAATNSSVTTTAAATLYIAGAPTAGTNETITNPYALYVNGGNIFFGGNTLTATGINAQLNRISLGNNAFTTSGLGTGGSLIAAFGSAITDNTTAAGGTLATANVSALASNQLIGSNGTVGSPVTYTNASTLYIAGAPTAGTNTAITNPYALYVNAGISAFNGGLNTGGGFGSNFYTFGGQGASNGLATAGLLFAGASTVTSRAIFIGAGSTTVTANNSYSNVIVGSSPITAASSGTHALLANMVINPIGTVTNASSVPITSTATLYVNGAGSGGTNNYSLYVKGSIASAATQTVVNCSTSGTATFSQPENGPSYKVVIAYENACLGTASYTFPIAFTNTPDSLGVNAARFTSISTSATTITGVTTTGYSQLYGY